MRLTWVQPEDLIAHELEQSRSEGKTVDDIRERWVSAGGVAEPVRGGATPDAVSPELRELARTLLTELDARVSRLPKTDSWDQVANLLRLPSEVVPAPSNLADRIHGAWSGRAAGCLLGKPVEKVPREGIEAILRSTGRWPLNAYFTAEGLDPAVNQRWPWNKRSAVNSLVENIDGMPEDDDLNYPILNLATLETAGSAFSTDDVAQAWLADLPAGRTFTAERVAYRNLLDGYSPKECARIRNPFREWIGALIRTDVYGWVHPGNLAQACRLAYLDARLSHTGNGLWGATWAAALTSSALVRNDVADVLADALLAVPEESKLAVAVRFGMRLGAQKSAVSEDLDVLHGEFSNLHWVHTVNNAALIAYALTRCDGDFAAGIALAVLAGWDTDSAAATVGSVLGALSGHSNLPAEWTRPLDNRIMTSLPGLSVVHIDDLAARTLALARSNSKESS